MVSMTRTTLDLPTIDSTEVMHFCDGNPGVRVALVSSISREHGRDVLLDLATPWHKIVHVHRTNGAERIVFPNGSMILLLTNSPMSWRGHALDRVVVLGWGLRSDVIDAALPCFMTHDPRG